MGSINMRWRTVIKNSLIYFFLIGGGLVTLIPLYTVITVSLHSDPYFFSVQENITLLNYLKIWQEVPLARFYFNSVVVAAATIFGVSILCAPCAYAFARIEFIGREILFWMVIATLMIPPTLLVIPNFLIVKHIPLLGGNDIFGQGGVGWLNSYWALIVPLSFNPLIVFLLRQFYFTIPRELEDAARMDGCNRFVIFLRIILPLTKPAMVVVVLYTFMLSWDAYLWPLIVLIEERMFTIPIGLAMFRDAAEVQWNILMAGCGVAAFPLLVIFVFTQRYFVRGVTLTGLKG